MKQAARVSRVLQRSEKGVRIEEYLRMEVGRRKRYKMHASAVGQRYIAVLRAVRRAGG